MASKKQRTNLTPKLIALAVASCFATGAALANPTGAAVVNGQVTINQAGNLLSITNSPNSIINWQAFSIGANEITRFTQQSAASAVLNRVVGSGGVIDQSVILGALQSNGRVFLINPSGIVFGAGSQIDVAGLVASSLNLSNADFLGGRLRFTEVPGAGSVVNQGAINAASGGQVYLVGPSVTNSGVITSPKGEVILAAGNSVELVNPGTPNLRVEITAPDNEAKNLGNIVAEAGRVGIYAGLITHSGTIRADSAVATEDGRIVLKATRNTLVEAGSTISASGPSGGQVTIQSGDMTLVDGTISATGSAGKGGTVKVLGNLVGLFDSSSIDVSGETGGGTALVGGDFQGKNPDVQNAFRTYFGPNAKIKADAIGNGDGGTVIVWSDDATRAYGSISARGGSQSGDGGFVEVSGKGWLDFHARVDTSAPKGRAGTLLLDPADVCIYNTDPSACSGEGASSFIGNFSGGMSSLVFTSSTGGSRSDLAWASSGSPAGSGGVKSLLNTNNVTITTSGGSGGMGSITIVEDLNLYNSPNLFQLVAHQDVNVNGRVWNSGEGQFRIYAGWNEAASPVSAIKADAFAPIVVNQGIGNININGNVEMQGNTLLRAGNNINIGNGQTVQVMSSQGSRTLTLHAGNAVTMNNGRLEVKVDGGEGFSAAVKVLAGAGGVAVIGGNQGPTGSGGLFSIVANASGGWGVAGGNATIQIGTPSEPVGGPIVIDGGARIYASPGYGSNSNGGTAQIDIVGSSILIQGGSGVKADYADAGGGSSGVGGSSAVQLISTSGDINLFNNPGFFFDNAGIISRAGDGDAGGGTARTIVSSAGAINVQGTFIGAEGGSGGIARVIMGANGAISVGSASSILADQQCCTATGTGLAAQISLIGNSIGVDGGSQIVATGGPGSTNGGAASVNLIGAQGVQYVGAADSSGFDPDNVLPTGPISIANAASIRALGGSGANRGGDAALTVLAGGPITITNTGPAGGGVGMLAVAGNGTAASGTGGNASTLVASLSSVNSTRSHIGSTGGSGGMVGGSAVSEIGAFGGDLVIDGSGAAPGSFFSQGGSATSTGGQGGKAETDLFSSGMTKVISERVDAHAGSGSSNGGGGGDALLVSFAFGGFSMMNSTVESMAGSGGQRGGKAETFVLADTIRLERTASSSSGSGGSTLPTGLRAIAGSSSSPSGILGTANTFLSVLSPTGSVDIVNERIDTSGGRRGSGATAVFGPAAIFLDFAQRTSGGFSVNGVDGAITGSPVGFFVNEQPAIPGTNFFVAYRGIVPSTPDAPPVQQQELPPTFDSQIISSLLSIVDDMAPKKEDSTPTKEEKDKKKKDREC